MEKFTLYNSGTKAKGLYTHEAANQELQNVKVQQKGVKVYCDEHYRILSKIPKEDADEQVSAGKGEQECESPPIQPALRMTKRHHSQVLVD